VEKQKDKMELKLEEAYRTANQWREGETTRLFQRVNYFLIGTAFLISPLIVLILSTNFRRSLALILLAYLLILVGLGISLVFTVSNFLNDRIIRRIIKYIIELEDGTEVNPNFVTVLINGNKKECLVQFLDTFCHEFWDAIIHFWVPAEPSDPKHNGTAGLTWLLPSVFIIFWLAVAIGLAVVLIFF